MGSDQDVVDAARVSYGRGTKKVSTSRALIRYLMRHLHTSPFEMVQLKWHVKLPIFVARQWIRHRTGAFNEYSARYSKLDQEMYIPRRENAMPQASNNKQGRSATELTEDDYNAVVAAMETVFEEAFAAYLYLLGPETTKVGDQEIETRPNPPDSLHRRSLVWKEAALNALMAVRENARQRGEEIEIDESMIDVKIKEFYDANGLAITGNDYPGLARELARCVIPVAVYTQWYWTVNLHNLMHFIRLRSDSHAQYEIRVYSDMMRGILTDLFPLCMEAFEEYQMGAIRFCKSEMQVLRELLNDSILFSAPEALKARGMTEREISEFMARFD